MNKDNRGLSLVETIVVVSIMTVLTAVGVLGVSMISGKPAERCAESIKIALLNNRTTALGKFSAEVLVVDKGDTVDIVETMYKQDADGNKAVDLSKTTTMNTKNVTVEYSITNKDTGYMPIPDDGLKISFNRSTGALEAPFTTTDVFIRCTKAGKSYVVQIYHLTGKVITPPKD